MRAVSVPFKIGDFVTLTSGGPTMIVVDHNQEGMVTAAWYAVGFPCEVTLHHGCFALYPALAPTGMPWVAKDSGTGSCK